MMGYYSNWGMMGWFGGIMMILFWLALVLLVVWIVRATVPAQRRDDGDVALDLLRRRFAAGEISQAEYEQARRILVREAATVPGAGGQL
jgi:putative membrane protein